jgi:hypothetical protein
MRTSRSSRLVVGEIVADLVARWQSHGHLLRTMDHLSEVDEDLRRCWDEISEELVRAVAAATGHERAVGRAPVGPPAAIDPATVGPPRRILFI